MSTVELRPRVRDETLRRWVRQPPADPNVQYLRDAERLKAWSLVEGCESVLDVGSEANVTAGLEAETVARIDFSAAAGDRATAALGDLIDRHETVDPDRPELPFDDDSVDAAVSVGPYDWRFLDIDALTRELHRVVRPNGRLVFTVPTRLSPYADHGWPNFRYFTPETALDIVSPHWRVDAIDPIFQYPGFVHRRLNRLPPRYQQPFVDIAWWLTDALDAADLLDDAAYLVVSATPLRYDRYLSSAVECLFRSTAEDGFWDEEARTIIRALRYETADGGLTWTPERETQWRYAPFALMGVLQWRSSPAGTDRYDDRIEQALAYFANRIADGETLSAMPSYGIGPLTDAFALAAAVFERPSHAETAWTLFGHATDRFGFEHAEDALALYGWARLYEYERDRDRGRAAQLEAAIDDALATVMDRLDSDCVFRFDNPTTERHQNQMYTLWGLCRAIEVLGSHGYLEPVERVLDDAVEDRMRDDGAFRWYEASTTGRIRQRLSGTESPPQWQLLFSCHQTFFVVAVAHYYAAGGSRNYDRALRRAMAWIYGHNDRGENLVDRSRIGVPMRFLTTDGSLTLPEQQFKGAYEIGAYLQALTQLSVGQLSQRRRSVSGSTTDGPQ